MEQPIETLYSDKALVVRILEGNTPLYGELMRKYNRRIFRICFSVVQNDALAEEMMQAAYVRAYERLGQFRFEASFGTWLARIALNECYAYRQKQQRIQEYLPGEFNLTDSETPHKTMVNAELRQLLENAINRLPEKHRTVFVLREVEGMSVAETMECLGLTEPNVKIRLSRAKEMLRESLSTYYKNSELFQFHLDRCDRVIRNVMQQIRPEN